MARDTDGGDAPGTGFHWVEPSDVLELQGLFRESFGRDTTSAYYHWQFLDGPLAGPHAAIARIGDEIVSHVGYAARDLVTDGRDGRGLIKCSSMTHPAHQGRGIYTALMEWCHGQFRDMGFDLVLSWPNARNHPSQRNRTSYEDICLIPTMRWGLQCDRRPLEREVPFRQATDVNMDEWEPLARLSVGSAKYSVVRSSAYLRWRYQRRPGTVYYVVESRKGGALQAALVCKLYPALAPDRINVVDWLCPPGDRSGETVLAELEEYAASVGLPTTVWHNVHDYPRHHVLERRGYVLGEPVFYFGVFALRSADSLGPYRDWRNWYISMGDVDVF